MTNTHTKINTYNNRIGSIDETKRKIIWLRLLQLMEVFATKTITITNCLNLFIFDDKQIVTNANTIDVCTKTHTHILNGNEFGCRFSSAIIHCWDAKQTKNKVLFQWWNSGTFASFSTNASKSFFKFEEFIFMMNQHFNISTLWLVGKIDGWAHRFGCHSTYKQFHTIYEHKSSQTIQIGKHFIFHLQRTKR